MTADLAKIVAEEAGLDESELAERTEEAVAGVYDTKEAGVAAALEAGFGALQPGDDGFAVRVCVCGRQDLHGHPDIAAIMSACPQCEVTIVGAPGNA